MKLWMRVGAYIDITEDEADAILGDPICFEMSKIIKKAFSEGKYTLDGNTYVPADSVEDFNDTYDTDYEIGEPECEL